MMIKMMVMMTNRFDVVDYDDDGYDNDDDDDVFCDLCTVYIV